MFKHNPDRVNQALSFFSVGENLAIASGHGDDYNFLFNLWNNERNNYDYNTGTCDKVCGHYTQVSNPLIAFTEYSILCRCI